MSDPITSGNIVTIKDGVISEYDTDGNLVQTISLINGGTDYNISQLGNTLLISYRDGGDVVQVNMTGGVVKTLISTDADHTWGAMTDSLGRIIVLSQTGDDLNVSAYSSQGDLLTDYGAIVITDDYTSLRMALDGNDILIFGISHVSGDDRIHTVTKVTLNGTATTLNRWLTVATNPDDGLGIGDVVGTVCGGNIAVITEERIYPNASGGSIVLNIPGGAGAFPLSPGASLTLEYHGGSGAGWPLPTFPTTQFVFPWFGLYQGGRTVRYVQDNTTSVDLEFVPTGGGIAGGVNENQIGGGGVLSAGPTTSVQYVMKDAISEFRITNNGPENITVDGNFGNINITGFGDPAALIHSVTRYMLKIYSPDGTLLSSTQLFHTDVNPDDNVPFMGFSGQVACDCDGSSIWFSTNDGKLFHGSTQVADGLNLGPLFVFCEEEEPERWPGIARYTAEGEQQWFVITHPDAVAP